VNTHQYSGQLIPLAIPTQAIAVASTTTLTDKLPDSLPGSASTTATYEDTRPRIVMMEALFQKASELGVPQIPVSNVNNATKAANNATCPTLESGLRLADQAGAMLVKK
jgi:hypothetical protein